jgi:hypothetical protein
MGNRPATRPDREDYREVLSPEEFVVFSKLREVRKQFAEKESVPAYTIFTNEQLAEMVRVLPDSATALGKLDENLERMHRELVDGTYVVGKYNEFKVHDPKERTIHAARFPDRVIHHALMNVREPVFERQLIFHTYACRVGKGRLKGIHALK